MLDRNVAAVRHFSRYYTRRIGVLEDSLLGSGLSLPQGRVLFEIAQGHTPLTPGGIAALLGLDPGYVSRLVAALEARGLIARQASSSDGRSVVLVLTEAGLDAYREIDARSRDEIRSLVGALPPDRQSRLIAAICTIEQELEAAPAAGPSVDIRDAGPGDIGWVIHRHAALYNQEYGWDWSFEALVARVGAEFIERFDPALECARVAETRGQVVGSAFVVRTETPGVAKLRLVYVEPEMRGTGLGRRLVDDCMAFARRAGYGRMTLWTNDPLVAARRLYERLGFVMTASEPVTAFGHAMKSEIWERDL